MGKIYILYGMSNAGKSTIEKMLWQRGFNKVVSHSTRPSREHEINGIDYNFVGRDEFDIMAENDEFIEYRHYETKHGIWSYGIHKSAIDLSVGDYICVVDVNGIRSLREWFGEENVVPIYLYLTDYWELLKRSIDRQLHASKEQCEEICRRFLVDIEDFKEAEKLAVFKVNNVNANETVDIITRNVRNNSI